VLCAPKLTGQGPKERGGHEELTEGLGPEEDSPEKEIDGEGGAPVRLPWGRRCRGEGELWGAVQGGEEVVLPLYRAEGEGGTAR
jgi:hypothetical protein